MDQTLITVLRYSITYYQKDLFICAQYANKHKATTLHKAYWLPCCHLPHMKYYQYFIFLSKELQSYNKKSSKCDFCKIYFYILYNARNSDTY